jgi:quinol monooxygenase YgiN
VFSISKKDDSGLIRFTAELVATAEKRQEIETILRSLVGPTSVLEGCISCRVIQDMVQPEMMRLEEEWESEESLHVRLRSSGFRTVLAAMDLSGEPPRVQFELPSGKSGMEYLSRIRRERGK